MPATAANTNTKKRATSVALTWLVHPVPSPSLGESNKVRMQSMADPTQQSKQPNKYLDVRKFLLAPQLLVENSPCSALALANTIDAMAETYRMLKNITKALGDITKALWHIEQVTQEDGRSKALPKLIKKLQSNLSLEMDNKLTTLEKKLTLLTTTQEQLKTAAKEIGQAADNIKTFISNMGNSIAQVTNTSSQLAKHSNKLQGCTALEQRPASVTQ